jgi:hypothetical protein
MTRIQAFVANATHTFTNSQNGKTRKIQKSKPNRGVRIIQFVLKLPAFFALSLSPLKFPRTERPKSKFPYFRKKPFIQHLYANIWQIFPFDKAKECHFRLSKIPNLKAPPKFALPTSLGKTDFIPASNPNFAFQPPFTTNAKHQNPAL